MSVARRIAEVIGTMTQAELAVRLGEKPKRINDILRGKQRVPEDFLVKFVEIFQVDANWLLTGKGEPGQLTPKEAALLDNYRNSDEAGQQALETTSALLAKPKEVKGKKAG